MTRPLEGVRALLVEDEAIIAMTAEDMLQELGCTVAATAATIDEALDAIARTDFDVALLDINLNGQASLTVAAALRAKGCPFVFTTGYGSAGRGEDYADIPLVTKPYQIAQIADAIRKAMAR